MRGRKPKPTALKRLSGNPGKRGYNHDEPVPPDGLPDCPAHLSFDAREEWHRLAATLHRMGILTTVDRAALAAYCQAWGRWVEAEEKLQGSPTLLKSPSGYVQQNPWLSIANKQLEIMGRYMAELGLTPASRSRVQVVGGVVDQPSLQVTFRTVYETEPEEVVAGQHTVSK
jgi:P27 family predicted phage terminase small subunit